jgi:adenylosuccinate lyase
MLGITSKLGFADAMRQHQGLGKLLKDEEIRDLTDPAGYLGECGASVDRVLAAQREWLGA